MTMVRSFARVDAVISSLLLLTVYVWYRGGGLQAVAPPAQENSPPVPAATAQSESLPASTLKIEEYRDPTIAAPVTTTDYKTYTSITPSSAKELTPDMFLDCAGTNAVKIAPPATSQKKYVFVPMQKASSAPKALMSSSKVLVPGFNPDDADAISKSIAAVRAWPKAPVDEISPSLPIASPRREIMGGSKSKTIAVDLNAKELEALRYEIARIQAQIARLEGRAEPIPKSATHEPASTARKTIMYSSKSGMIVLPPEPQSQTQSRVKAATQWTRQQSGSQAP